MTAPDPLARDLARLVGGAANVRPPTEHRWLQDASASRGISGRADAVVLPTTPGQVAAVIAWCYAHDLAITPRGGGTGFSGGAVPIDGGVVVALERLTRIRQFDPELWRINVEAGVTTAHTARLAREHGLLFAPDPGAAEQSQIGGNIATNAGGPHAFKYGTTGAWVTGIEAVLAPGELIGVGGPTRKDVAGYDLAALLTGSEGTLGIVTSAWLRLVPAPETAHAVVAFYETTAAGCDALLQVLAGGVTPAALEFLDAGAIAAARGSYPGADAPADGRLMLLAEADGSAAEAGRIRDELVETLAPGALALEMFDDRGEVRALWRWRDGVSLAVSAQRGGKLSSDISVPVDRVADAIDETVAIGRRHGLDACSWGHAGDGNLHSTFLLDPSDADELDRAELADAELFALATALGGSVSGEHGLGVVKGGFAAAQWRGPAAAAQLAVKRALDPKGLINPGKKCF